MSIFKGDASEVYRLAGGLSQVGAKAVPALREGMAAAGEALAKEWAANVEETSGTHLPYLPKAIDSSLAVDFGGVSVDIGPNNAKKQGRFGKGDEFGSENQSPHLNGLRALDGMQVRTERIIDAAVAPLLP